MRVMGYVRVGNEEQTGETNSIEAQQERVETYCTAHNWQLQGIETDNGYSPKNINRPGFNAVLQTVQANKVHPTTHKVRAGIDVVLVDRIDRLACSIRDLSLLIELFLQYSVKLVSITDDIDATTPNGRLVLNTLMAAGAFERDVLRGSVCE